MIRVGVIGYGYWGPNIVRNFQQTEGSRVVAVCDKSDKSLRRVRQAYPDLRVTFECRRSADRDGYRRYRGSHARLDALRIGQEGARERKARLCRKAIHVVAAQAEELIELAERKNLKIMVDHTFLFTGAVQEDPPS